MNALAAMFRAEPGSVGAVKAVSVISAGTVRIHPEHLYRTRKPLYFDIVALGYTLVDVDPAIVSHLHVDHIGGLRELKGARLLMSAAEWAELAKPVPGCASRSAATSRSRV